VQCSSETPRTTPVDLSVRYHQARFVRLAIKPPSAAPRLGEALAESTAETARIGIEGLVVDGPVPMPYKQRRNTIDANVCFNRSFRRVP
jgi:hypothetical protein